jgi:hypothetical protein
MLIFENVLYLLFRIKNEDNCILDLKKGIQFVKACQTKRIYQLFMLNKRSTLPIEINQKIQRIIN